VVGVCCLAETLAEAGCFERLAIELLIGMGLDAVALRQETALLHIDFEHVQDLLLGIPLCWRLSKPQGSV
jgi:hypothetical protein